MFFKGTGQLFCRMSQFEFVWSFLIIRLKLCFLGSNIKWWCYISLSASTEEDPSDVAFDHLVKIVYPGFPIVQLINKQLVGSSLFLSTSLISSATRCFRTLCSRSGISFIKMLLLFLMENSIYKPSSGSSVCSLLLLSYFFHDVPATEIGNTRMFVNMLSHFSRVWFFVTLWTVAHQAPLSMGVSRQK